MVVPEMKTLLKSVIVKKNRTNCIRSKWIKNFFKKIKTYKNRNDGIFNLHHQEIKILKL